MSHPAEHPAQARLRAFLDPGAPDVFHPVETRSEIWRPDPVDVPQIHQAARVAFGQTLGRSANHGDAEPGRILVIEGPAGVGKTHLLRAFRRVAHAHSQGIFVYVQFSASASDFGRNVLSQVVDSLELPFDVQRGPGTTMDFVVEQLLKRGGSGASQHVHALRTARTREAIGDAAAELVDVLMLEDSGLAPLDPDLLRALVALGCDHPAVRALVFKYLRCEPIARRDMDALGWSGRSEESDPVAMVTWLGRLVRRATGASFVLAFDQMEDLLPGARQMEEDDVRRVTKALQTVREVSERVPGAVVLMAVLDGYLDLFRGRLPASLFDRLEKAPPPVKLVDVAEHATLERVIAKRLAHLFGQSGVAFDEERPLEPFAPSDVARLAGSTWREVLDACRAAQVAARAKGTPPRIGEALEKAPALAAAPTPGSAAAAPFDDQWREAQVGAELFVPAAEEERLELLVRGLACLGAELGAGHHIAVEKRSDHAWISVNRGEQATDRFLVTVIERSAQAGALRKPLTRILNKGGGKPVRIVRSSPWPQVRDQVVRARLAEIESEGGAKLQATDSDWRTLAAFVELVDRAGSEPGFQAWQAHARVLAGNPLLTSLAAPGKPTPPSGGPGGSGGPSTPSRPIGLRAPLRRSAPGPAGGFGSSPSAPSAPSAAGSGTSSAPPASTPSRPVAPARPPAPRPSLQRPTPAPDSPSSRPSFPDRPQARQANQQAEQGGAARSVEASASGSLEGLRSPEMRPGPSGSQHASASQGPVPSAKLAGPRGATATASRPASPVIAPSPAQQEAASAPAPEAPAAPSSTPLQDASPSNEAARTESELASEADPLQLRIGWALGDKEAFTLETERLHRPVVALGARGGAASRWLRAWTERWLGQGREAVVFDFASEFVGLAHDQSWELSEHTNALRAHRHRALAERASVELFTPGAPAGRDLVLPLFGKDAPSALDALAELAGLDRSYSIAGGRESWMRLMRAADAERGLFGLIERAQASILAGGEEAEGSAEILSVLQVLERRHPALLASAEGCRDLRVLFARILNPDAADAEHAGRLVVLDPRALEPERERRWFAARSLQACSELLAGQADRQRSSEGPRLAVVITGAQLWLHRGVAPAAREALARFLSEAARLDIAVTLRSDPGADLAYDTLEAPALTLLARQEEHELGIGAGELLGGMPRPMLKRMTRLADRHLLAIRRGAWDEVRSPSPLTLPCELDLQSAVSQARAGTFRPRL